MIDQKSVGARIELRRRNRGWTQAQLAKAMNVSPQAVSKWERGKTFPDPLFLDELAAALHCSIDELLTGVSSKSE